MKLIGMLDSPYVRRVAIVFDCLGVAFEHEAVSVFTTFEQFQNINPVVKAPTLVCDDGEVLMDSSLIIQYVELVVCRSSSLWPDVPVALQHDFRALGLALAACEKSVQTIYERKLRPAEVHFEPWLSRVHGQMLAAYDGLEQEVSKRPSAFEALSHASIMTAIAWQFTQSQLAEEVPMARYPLLSALSERMESLPPFLKYLPTGPGVPSVN